MSWNFHQVQVLAEDTVNNTAVVENILCNTCNNNPGYKVRQIRNGLRYFLNFIKNISFRRTANAIAAIVPTAMSRKLTPNVLVNVCVEQTVFKCICKVLKSTQVLSPDRKCERCRFYLLKRHRPSPQRNVLEDNQPDYKWY